MIVVQTTVRIDPERYDEALAQLTDLVEASRNVDGVRRYAATEDLLQPNTIRFFEVYEDAEAAAEQEDLDAYRRFVEALPGLAEGEIESVQFETEDLHEAAFTAADAVASLE